MSNSVYFQPPTFCFAPPPLYSFDFRMKLCFLVQQQGVSLFLVQKHVSLSVRQYRKCSLCSQGSTTAICLAQLPPSTPTLSICFVTAIGQIASAMTLLTTGTSQPAVGHCAQWPSCKTTR